MRHAARGVPPVPRLVDEFPEADRQDRRLGRCRACSLASPPGWRTVPYQLYGPRRTCRLCLEVELLLGRARRLQRESAEFEHLLELLRLSSSFVERSLAGPPGHDNLEEFEAVHDQEPELEADPEPRLVVGQPFPGDIEEDAWVEPLAHP